MLNLIQSNTSNFRNFVELQLTSHILKKQVFNTVPGDVIKVSNLFGEVNQFESIISSDWESSTNFHLLWHLTLSSTKSEAENLPCCHPDARGLVEEEEILKNFGIFEGLENLYNGTQYQFSLLALFWKHFTKFQKLFQLNISGLRKTNSFSYFRKLLDSLKGI